MSDMKITLPSNEAITISGQTIDKLIRAGDGDAALLYLYILKMNGELTASQAAIALDKSKGWVASATAVLSRLGLANIEDKSLAGNVSDQKPLEEPRNYTVEEVRNELSSGSEFSFVIDETQRVLGRILTPEELLRLFGIYDYLRLPVDVIMLLITYCVTESRKTGAGRVPSVRYIEKQAFIWEREGLFTAEKAEGYLKKLEERKSIRNRIKEEMQIRDRELSATEARYVDGWIMMGMEPDAVAIAYDKTMVKTGKLAWAYMDSIIKSWHSRKLLTAAQVKEVEGKQKNNQKVSQTEKHGNPNRDDLARMTRILNEMKRTQ